MLTNECTYVKLPNRPNPINQISATVNQYDINKTRTTFLSPKKACSQDSPYKHFTSIPYVQGTSEKIRRVLNEAGVNVATRPVHTFPYTHLYV